MVFSVKRSVVKTESENLRPWSVHSSNGDLLNTEFFVEIEAMDFGEIGVHDWARASSGDSGLLVSICADIDLHNLSDQDAVLISRIGSTKESSVGLGVEQGHAAEDALRVKRLAGCRSAVEHIN